MPMARRDGLAQGGHGERVCVRLGNPKSDARKTRDEGRSDLGHPVTLLAALETRSALGVALYRLPRLSLSLSYTLSVLGEYVGRKEGSSFHGLAFPSRNYLVPVASSLLTRSPYSRYAPAWAFSPWRVHDEH